MRREVGALNDELRPLQMRYSQERERLEEMRKLQAKRDQLLINISTAETVSRFHFFSTPSLVTTYHLSKITCSTCDGAIICPYNLGSPSPVATSCKCVMFEQGRHSGDDSRTVHKHIKFGSATQIADAICDQSQCLASPSARRFVNAQVM